MGEAGRIIGYGSTGAAPSGWLLCDGGSYLRTAYPDLFAAIGVVFGAADADHFNVPDLRGRFPVGADASHALGSSGGALDHPHGGPAHIHPVTQPAAHSAHAVTQPAAHTDLAHSGADLADHAAVSHTGSAVAAHSVTHSSGHGTHSSAGSHDHNTHTFDTFTAGGNFPSIVSPGLHTAEGSHTHDAHSAHDESVSGHSVSSQGADHPIQAHTVTQPASHTLISHSGTTVDAHSAHSGFAAGSASAATGTANPPFMALPFLIGTGTDVPPVGGIFHHGAAAAPDANHLVCDGSSLLRASYPDLFAAIGTTFGAVDGTHFNLPDLRGRHILGKAAAGTGSVHGGTGGSAGHTHSGGSHTHPVTQGADHTAHAVGQPAAHTLAHSGAAASDHSMSHSGWTVADHTVTQSSGHGTHTSAGSHNHNNHGQSTADRYGVTGASTQYWAPSAHTNSGSHSHNAHSAHTGAALSSHAETQAATHTGSHTITQPSTHTLSHIGAALSAHSAHAGAGTNAAGTGATSAADAPYLGATPVIKAVASTMPIGAIMPVAQGAAPAGTLLANGAAVSRATYASLFGVIGTTFGAGDGVNTFNVPDLRGRIAIGSGGSGPALAAAGGSMGHTHTGPSHSHSVTQPSNHADHTATQPGGHGAVAHTSFAAATHSLSHTGMALTSHTATQASGHGTHTSGGSHTHDAHDSASQPGTAGPFTYMTGPGTHSSDGSHTHDAHSAHSGFGVNAHSVTQASAHSMSHTATQPADHAPSAHSGFAVDAHSAHSGFATSADGAAATDPADPAYLTVNYAIQAGVDVESHNAVFALTGGGAINPSATGVENPVPATPPSSPTIYVLDASTLSVLGMIQRAAKVKVTRRLFGVDTCSMSIDARQAYASQIVKGVLLYLPAFDFDAPLAFLVEQVERDEDAQSKDIVATGRTIDGIALVERVCLPPVGQSHDVQTATPAETAIKHYVTQNAGTGAAASRQVPHFAVATSSGGGTNVDAAGRYQPVVDIVRELGFLSGLGWKCSFEAGTNTHTFETIAGTDRTASVFFDFEFSTIEKWIEVDTAAVKSLVVVGGQGEGVDRDIITRPAVEPTGLDRREGFVDARDVDQGNTTLLQQRGDAVLAASGAETSVTATPRQFGAFQYTRDWHLGDYVTLRNRDRGIQRSARVIEVTLESTSSAAVPVVSAVLDKAEPTLKDQVQGTISGAAHDSAGTTALANELVLDTANQDIRFRRSAAKTVEVDDNAGGAATMNVVGSIKQGGVQVALSTDAAAGPDTDVTIDAAGAAGTAGTFARHLHGHKVATTAGPGADVTVDAAGAAGATGAVARAGHGHKVATSATVGAAIGVATPAAGATGAIARATHGHALAHGNAFPTSPAPVSGDFFYRDDKNMEFRFNGTNWLSTELFQTPFQFTSSLAASGEAGRRERPPLLGGTDLWVEKLHLVFNVAAGGSALGASHNWIGKITGYNGAVDIYTSTFTINSGASGTWRLGTDFVVNAMWGATYVLWLSQFAKTGTPGDLYAMTSMSYRIVAT